MGDRTANAPSKGSKRGHWEASVREGGIAAIRSYSQAMREIVEFPRERENKKRANASGGRKGGQRPVCSYQRKNIEKMKPTGRGEFVGALSY